MAQMTTMTESELPNIVLEKMKVVVGKRFSGQLLHDLTLQTEIMRDEFDGLAIKLSSYVMAEEVDKRTKDVAFEYPKNWIEMFKEQHFSDWLKERFPVKYKTITRKVTFRKMATYPKLNRVFPDEQNKVVFRSNISDY
jgi:hypothetical protein